MGLFFLAMSLTGCSAEHQVGTDLPSTVGIGQYQADPALQQQALSILSSQCLACHGAVGSGGVSQITDVNHLINSGLITPGQANQGRLLGSIREGSMPKAGPLPPSELASLENWVSSMTLVSGEVGGPNPTPPSLPLLEASYTSLFANIFQPKCVACHKSGNAKGGVNYENYSQTIATGKIQAGSAAGSGMIEKVETGEMPPARDGYPRLTSEELNVLRAWVDAGALNN